MILNQMISYEHDSAPDDSTPHDSTIVNRWNYHKKKEHF